MKQKNTNFKGYWDLIKQIIIESDIVLEILDARFIELSRNKEVERLIKEMNRPVIFVINKSDLVSKRRLKNQIKKLDKDIDFVFLSTKDSNSMRILLYKIKETFKKYGKREISDEQDEFLTKYLRKIKGNIVVGILGYPNVGKSSIINALCHKKKAIVSKKAGTTHGIHWIKATEEIKFIDSPGVIPLEKKEEVKDALINARNKEKLKDPRLVAYEIIKLFLKINKKFFEDFYKIKITNTDLDKIIKDIAIKKRYLLKQGKPDENRAYMTIIKDWQDSKIRL